MVKQGQIIGKISWDAAWDKGVSPIYKKNTEYKQLEDEQWLLDVAFLTDLTNMLNELNLEL